VPVLRAQARTRRGLQVELRRAFAENEFELYFQPQIRLADGAVVGAEALLRWRHPERGVVSPGAFIQTLAESSIATAVGAWIVRDACAKTAAWRTMGLSLNRIGINLFPIQCRDPAMLRDIEEALHTSSLPADILELEISETFALNNDDAIMPLQQLHSKGIKLAVDDFGTGYASLSYLAKFPVSRIKIDRSFVVKVTDDAENAAIVRSLIAMAHNLKLGIIAEGVETEAQRGFSWRNAVRRRKASCTLSRFPPPTSKPICANGGLLCTSPIPAKAVLQCSNAAAAAECKNQPQGPTRLE
jgi:EAL domain-containing protein (putative c-di-GMP-specific phosphodiesterase class I)